MGEDSFILFVRDSGVQGLRGSGARVSTENSALFVRLTS